MLPDRVSNPGPLALESDALPTGLGGLAIVPNENTLCDHLIRTFA